MRIDHISVRNFKKFSEQSFTLHPQFTLLVGDNGSGKSSLLDALAVALGIWLVKTPDSSLVNSRRGIWPSEILLRPTLRGDRLQFVEEGPVVVTAKGELGEQRLEWTRQVKKGTKVTDNSLAKEALAAVAEIYQRAEAGETVHCPVLAYYGPGRAWIPSNERRKKSVSNGPSRRWAAFYDCLNQRIRLPELKEWFRREAIASVNRGGRPRPGYEVVRQAVRRCLPGAGSLTYDGDRDEIIVEIAGEPRPFGTLSDGQRTMVSLVADIAVKAITQNAFLLPADELEEADLPLARVLRETSGVVLIDELDVHLHPKWQRRVIEDLQGTFPSIQFIASSHSPFVIQTLAAGQLLMLEGQPLGELGNKPLTEIARMMGVENPETSNRYHEMVEVAKGFFRTLEEAAVAPAESLQTYLEKLADLKAPYADNPAFQAFLELKHEAKLGERIRALADGKVVPAARLSPAERKIAEETLSLTGLDRKVSEAIDENGRVVAIDRQSQRMEAWGLALVSKMDLQNEDSPALRRQIVRTAQETGFFSIWLAAFNDDPEMSRLFIRGFTDANGQYFGFAGTAQDCFDKTGNPVSPRPANGLPAASKI